MFHIYKCTTGFDPEAKIMLQIIGKQGSIRRRKENTGKHHVPHPYSHSMTPFYWIAPS
jgi:hypothetical protein